MKTYLSGGIEYAKEFGSNWREEMEKWITINLNHEVFNPSKESILFFKERFPDLHRNLLKKESEVNIRRIIGELVLFECEEIIKNCDYIICFWDSSCSKGAGTQGELTIAKYFNKPVFIVSDISLEQIPSWIIGCSTKIFFKFDSLKVWLKNIYLTR